MPKPSPSAPHWNRVDRLLSEECSSEQISFWLAQEKALFISREWIYQHDLKNKRQGGDLYRFTCASSRARSATGTMTAEDSFSHPCFH